jgi:hypothetical protein
MLFFLAANWGWFLLAAFSLYLLALLCQFVFVFGFVGSAAGLGAIIGVIANLIEFAK